MQPQRTSQNNLGESYSAESLKQRQELQGECKIQKLVYLQFSWGKSILLFSLLTVSVVGLLLLKYYKNLRAKVFYSHNATCGQATHVYIQSAGRKQEQIVPLQKDGQDIYFHYKKLKYEVIEDKCYPVGLNFEAYLQENLSEEFMKTGLKSKSVEEHLMLFGRNEHIVSPPTYFEYLYDILTQPFFFIQYLAAVIYILEKMPELSALLIGASVFTTSINYIILYISYRKIKEMAEVVVAVQVLRNGTFIELPSSELVPGDLFIPKNELLCDVILLKGGLYVNEANLTGESIPIGKNGIDKFQNFRMDDNSIWIYEGSKILSSQNPLAMVVHTGYSSKKGRILRKILHRNPQVPHFFTTYIYFMIQVYIIGVLAYLGTLPLRIYSDNLQQAIILLDFLLIITFCFPPSGPIYFNLVYSFSLIRLKSNNILGTEPQKTVEGAHLRIMCFDKTGTLTQDTVQVNHVIRFNAQNYQEINQATHRDSLDFKLFASCHTVREFDEQLKGDEVDLKTFLHSGYRLRPSTSPSICFEVEQKQSPNPIRLRILKIYQYQSKFQSMSVLALDTRTNKYYVFAKGAPEVIHRHSINKFQYFEQLLQTESYGGFRTIGYGFKEIDVKDLEENLGASRSSHLNQIQMMGLLVFQNKLKHDARQTIQRLQIAGINSRMITGDNIYIAIETAMRCGILQRKDQVVVLEGKNLSIPSHGPEGDIRFDAKIFRFAEGQVQIKEEVLTFQNYFLSPHPIIVDNDFLKLRPDLKLSPQIRVYSRISPQNKALIVRKIRSEIAIDRKKLRWIDKLFSNEEQKVGMVGDGANDLLAIKEANIGIGIRNCDSSYAASFSILNLMDIDYIIREAKCSEREIIEICRFMSIGGLLTVPCIIIMETQASFYSSFDLVFDNFTKYLLFPILIALSRPAADQTPHKPSSNFLKKQNQLVFLGNVVISTLAIAATVIYYRRQAEYVYNTAIATVESGWTSNDSLVASEYLYYSLQPVVLVLCIYESKPWKEPLYRNILLLIATVLNLIFQVGYYFIQPQLSSFFGVPEISYPCLIVLLIIGAVASVLVFIWSQLISALNMHQQQSPPCLTMKDLVELAQTGSTSGHN